MNGVTKANLGKVHPETKANLLLKWTLCWPLPLFYKNYRKTITEDDLPEPLPDHTSDLLGNKLETLWLQSDTSRKLGFLKTLIRVFGVEFLIYGLVYIPTEFVLRLSRPFIIAELLGYFSINQKSVSTEKAYILTTLLFVTTTFYSGIRHYLIFKLSHLGMKMRVAASSLIYRKCLKLNQTVFHHNSVGQIVNLLANDVSRFDYCLLEGHTIYVAPLLTLLILAILAFKLGYTTCYGFVVFAIGMLIHVILSRQRSKYRMKTALRTDKRVKIMKDILVGIKIIKLYAWEKAFSKLVNKARKLEMASIISNASQNGIYLSMAVFLRRVANFVCVLGFLLRFGTLTAEHVYVLFAFYEIVSISCMDLLPVGLMRLAEVNTSIKRVQKFLTLPEVKGCTKISTELSLQNVYVKWKESSQEYALSNITFNVIPNKLLTIIGPVGGGKSTLLQTILQEIPLTKGQLYINGKLSYAAQDAWIFNGSIRENILFGTKFDKLKFEEVIKVCALEPDLANFSHGDQTLVGERGITLSGGQRARINLARSVYREADIYLFDDPLSAVDVSVGKQIFEQCFLKFLANKTKILVTHQFQYLQQSDKIYVVKNGAITFEGNYEQLQDKESDILHLLQEKKEIEDQFDNQVDFVAEEDDQNLETPETQKDGIIPATIYFDYIGAGGGLVKGCLVVLFAGFAILCSHGTDYYLSVWIKNEEKRFFNITETLNQNQYLYIYSGLTLLSIPLCLTSFCFYTFFCTLISRKLHKNMLERLIYSPMNFFTTNSSGRILNRFSRDIGLIDEEIPLCLVTTTYLAFTILSTILIVLITNPWILIATLLFLILCYFIRKIALLITRTLKRIEAKLRSPIYTYVSSTLEGLTTIRAFGVETNAKQTFDILQDKHSSCFYLYVACDAAYGWWIDLCNVVYFGCIIYSFLFVNSGFADSDVGLCITHLLLIAGLLQWGLKLSASLENQMTSVERVMEYTQLNVEKNDNVKEISQNWPSDGRIQFDNVSLRYSADAQFVLKNLIFDIKPKEKIGIVGRTGAGKSSLITALFRLAPIEGSIFIDNIDTNTVLLEKLRSSISIIPQEPVLFTGTIRYNLDPFDEYSDERLWEVLDEVELKNAIVELTNGLFSKVSEGGINFSVGQRQLLCLARAALRKNKILVLDEATANVDPKTDELIQKSIRNKFTDCTILTISHRLSTVIDYDKILVMNEGTVAEFDSVSNLMKNEEGIFYNLMKQSGGIKNVN